MLSMTHYVYHNQDQFFPDASSFRPERWLDDSAREAENEKNFISFSRGSRNCVGMNLAYAELYYGFAHLFRRFEITKADSMQELDMEWYDAFVVATYGHLKAKVKRLED